MGFERFGRVSFTAQTKTKDFVDYLEKGELRGTRCRSCGRQFFPPRSDCYYCLSSDMEWFLIEGEGRLVTYTKVNYAPTGFEADVPYILALVNFNGIKVFGRFNKDVPEEQLEVGINVKVSTCSLPDGQLSYEFLPASLTC